MRASYETLSAEEMAMVADLWPMRELMTSETGSLELESVSEFAMQLLLGDHLEDVVVLREGCARLGLSEAEALPAWLRASLEGCRTALEFLRKAEAHPEAARHTARLESTEDDGVQREVCSMGVKRRFDEAEPDSWRGLSRRCLSCAQRVAQEDDEACCSREASSSRAAAGGRSGTLYVCELQRLRSRARGPSTTEDAARLPATRSARTRSTREAFGDLARWTLAWDDVNDGLFVGGKGAGKGLHIDQVFWSNVGVNWRGHKLLATWPAGEASSRARADFLDVVFAPPLSAAQLEALRGASRVVLLRPGDVFVVSGGVAHTTLVAAGLNVTGYESLVTLHPALVEHVLRTGGRRDAECDSGGRGVMDDEDLESYLRGIAHSLTRIADHPRVRRAQRAAPNSFPVVLLSDAELSAVETVLRSLLVDAVKHLARTESFFTRSMPPDVLRAAKRIAHEQPTD